MKTRKKEDKTLLCNRNQTKTIFPFTQWKFNRYLVKILISSGHFVASLVWLSYTYPSYIIWVCLTNAKQWPDRKGQPGGKFSHPVRFFRKPSDRCHWVCYKEVWQDKLTSLCRQLSESWTGLPSSHRPFVASQHLTKNTLEISGFHVPGTKFKTTLSIKSIKIVIAVHSFRKSALERDDSKGD